MSLAGWDLNFRPGETVTCRGAEEYDYVGALFSERNLLVSQICARHAPISLPGSLKYTRLEYASLYPLTDLPSFEFQPYRPPPAARSPFPDKRQEWKRFLTFLHERDKVAIIPIDGWELIIKPPNTPPEEGTCVRVCYRKLSTNRAVGEPIPLVRQTDIGLEILRPRGEVLDPPSRHELRPNLDVHCQDTDQKRLERPGILPVPSTPAVQPRLGLMHPSYLQTLGQTHASWLFGGIAELVDNARDALATRLNISVQMVKMKEKQEIIPMLCVEDNGKGMTHSEIVRMLSFGHSTPKGDNRDHIGHFGVGFKTGSMRIGKDVVVLTQSETSRSIGLLSSSYNTDKEVLEVPIVTFRKVHGIMELDPSVQSEEEGQACLNAVKQFSPFNEFDIGSLFEKISSGDSKNGTHVFIYNLDKWGTEYFLLWDSTDISIRSKRVRTRPGQTSKEIPLDYSLRSYLEVLFLEPRMIIRIQGARVKTTRLAVSLNTTERHKGKGLTEDVELTLGRSPVEYKRGNCGIFLYWHGRLIEAFKRVGGMIHSADMGRGVIGVIDVTPLMENKDGRIGVLNTKQGFEDSEEYCLLEKWLGEEFNKYWYAHFDDLEVIPTKAGEFEPDREWVQCDKCQKWRKLPRGEHARNLPEEWFCYMKPFQKTCKDPEEKVQEDIVTVGTNRTSALNSGILKSPAEIRPKIVVAKEENLEDDDVEESQSQPVPARRQSLRRIGHSANLSSEKLKVSAGDGAEVKVDGKRVINDSPPKRRLRRRS